jgi:hypothetical protein
MRKLSQIASVIRTKNAGPYVFTCDIFFKSPVDYQSIRNSKKIDKELIAKLYKIPEEHVQSIIFVDEAEAVKINIKRPVVSGDIGDTDVLACQQHAPLLNIVIP